MKLYAMAFVCASLLSLPIIAQKMDKEPRETIRIVAVDPTPEPETVVATIQLPKPGQVLNSSRAWLQVRLDGYSLGNDSQFDRASEVLNSNLGQTLHVVVDNDPYFSINGPSIEPFNEDGWYYNQNYKVELPQKLSPGLHTLRVFLARSFGESLKGERTFHSTFFFISEEERAGDAKILSKPYLTYNEPSARVMYIENKPVLLDFYITNCELSSDGYKVKLTIDGRVHRNLISWQPYYLYGLKKGKHTVRLELIDEHNKLVPGRFNDVEQTIVVR